MMNLTEKVAKLKSVDDGNFAQSLVSQFERRGSLSPKQILWVDKLLPREDLLFMRITALMESCGLTRFAIRTERLRLTRARNGAILISDHNRNILGTIKNCFLTPTRMSAQQIAELQLVETDPLQHARLYGSRTGNCCFCFQTYGKSFF